MTTREESRVAADQSSTHATGVSRATGAARAERLVVGVVVLVGVVLRFATTSHLWLDEALSVDIARLPLGQIPEALRHDGHPPLYYFLLHGWMQIFGEGDVAVRALSGVFGVALLPLAWVAGRRLGGRLVAYTTVVVLGLSPYALRYSTETRMYSLVMVLVLAGWLLVDGGLRGGAERPRPVVLVGIAIVSGMLLLTHYWALWLVLATVGLLVMRAVRRRESRRTSLALAVAVAAGFVLLVPWVPSLLDQTAHTGTPWATPARPTLIVYETLTDFGGGDYAEGYLLGIGLLVLAAVGLLGRSVDDHRIELDVRTVGPARPLALAVAATLAVACAAEYATGTTFASRYAAVVFPLFIAVAGVGLARFDGRTARCVVAAGLLALGLAGAYDNVTSDRTQAGDIAAAIRAEAGVDDMVVICPDQLGPAIHRLLPAELAQATYPRFESPDRVDWVDYEPRNRAADPAAFAAEVVRRTSPDATIWLVASGAYRTLEGQCEAVGDVLGRARGGVSIVVVENADDFFEHASLLRFAPAP